MHSQLFCSQEHFFTINKQMDDAPSGTMTKKVEYENDFVGFDRKIKFELMLVAIEENSGCMAVLASVHWNYNLNIERDPSKPLHYQTKLNKLKIESFFDESECFVAF